MFDMQIDKPIAASLVWFRIAVVYFAAAVVIGIFMGARGDFSLLSVHAHMNLLGWEALALMGLIYHHLPRLGRNRIARVHFWLHNAGLPVLMMALAARALGNTSVEPVVAGASSVVGAAVLLFALNILINGKAREIE
jgi:hypothetical protein